jgi:hypothetical protein
MPDLWSLISVFSENYFLIALLNRMWILGPDSGFADEYNKKRSSSTELTQYQIINWLEDTVFSDLQNRALLS